MMKPCLICLELFIILSCWPNPARSQNSCSQKLNFHFPFDASSLKCVPIWPAHNLLLRYAEAPNNTINFVLSFPKDIDSYVAIGFSDDGKMVGSDAVVAWVDDGKFRFLSYHLSGKNPDQVTSTGDQPTTIDSTTLKYIYSTRPVKATLFIYSLRPVKATPYLILAIGPKNSIPSAPNYVLAKHRDINILKIDYRTGRVVFISSVSLRRSHGGLNIVGWSLVLMVGAMIARYGKKWDPYWLYLHASIQSLGFLAGVAGIICGLVLSKKVHVTHHKNLGILILILGFLQVIALVLRPRKESSLFRKYWNYYHHNVGRILLLFAFVNVFYGLHLGSEGSKWFAGYGISVAFLVIIAIILEIRMRLMKPKAQIQLGHWRSPDI